MARAVAASLTQTRLDFANSYLSELPVAISIHFSASKTVLLEWYVKTIPVQLPPFYNNSTGFQSASKLSSEFQLGIVQCIQNCLARVVRQDYSSSAASLL